MDKTIVVNIERCLACRGCEIACALIHSKSGVLEAAVSESPKPQRMVSVEPAGEFAVPMQCRHCEDAPCITVCPTAAIYRHDINTPVLIEQEKCIGCRFCLAICPFGAIDIARDGKAVVKCDLCIERTQTGREPACVEACPTKALRMASEKELAAARRKRAARDVVLSSRKNAAKIEHREDA